MPGEWSGYPFLVLSRRLSGCGLSTSIPTRGSSCQGRVENRTSAFQIGGLLAICDHAGVGRIFRFEISFCTDMWPRWGRKLIKICKNHNNSCPPRSIKTCENQSNSPKSVFQHPSHRCIPTNPIFEFQSLLCLNSSLLGFFILLSTAYWLPQR